MGFRKAKWSWETRERARQAETDQREAWERDEGNERRERAETASDVGRGRIRKEKYWKESVYARNNCGMELSYLKAKNT